MRRSPAPAHRERKIRGLWGLAGLLFIVLSVVLLYTSRAQRAVRTPDDSGLRLAQEIIHAELREGDGMTFLPAFSATQRWRFSKLWRDAGMDFAEHNPLGDPIEPWDLDGLKRLWILTSHDRDHGLQTQTLGSVLRHEPLGAHMTLLLVALPPSRTVFDFQQHLLEAKLERISEKGDVELCKARTDKLSCPGKWWKDVFARTHQVGGSRHRGIFIQPHPDRGVTRLLWDNLPPARRLEGRFGNRLWAVRHDSGSKVELRIIIGQQERHRMTIAPGDFVYHSFGFDLDPEDLGQPIRFELRAKDTTWRQTCLDARLLGPPSNE